MKTEAQIREKCKELFNEYQKLGEVEGEFVNSKSVVCLMDIAIAKFEALNWVFEDD